MGFFMCGDYIGTEYTGEGQGKVRIFQVRITESPSIAAAIKFTDK